MFTQSISSLLPLFKSTVVVNRRTITKTVSVSEYRGSKKVRATHTEQESQKALGDTWRPMQQRSLLSSWPHLTAASFTASSAAWTNPVSVPVISATSSTSCARQSWRCRVTSKRPSCCGKRPTSIRLSPWYSAWGTPNRCCTTPPTPTKRWWSCPAPGSCPSTLTLWQSSSPSSPLPPRSVGGDEVKCSD